MASGPREPYIGPRQKIGVMMPTTREEVVGGALARRAAGNAPPGSEDADWAGFESAWDTLTGQATFGGSRYNADVGHWTSELEALAQEYARSPLYAPLAARAAGDRASREASSRAASGRGANSALMMREAEMMNEGRDRQIAADAAAAAAQEGSQRYATIADILTGAGNLDVTAQGISSGSNTAMAGLEAENNRRNVENRQQFWAGLINTGAAALAPSGGGGQPAPPYTDPSQQTYTPGFPVQSDIRGKEQIQPLDPGDQQIFDELAAAEAAGRIDTRNHDFPASDPVLERALLADLETQAVENTQGQRDALFEAAVRPRPAPPSSSGSAGSGLLGLLGAAAGGIFGGPAGAAAGGAAGGLIESELSDRRKKTRIKPINYSYSDKLGKEEVALLEMATKPAANRENLGPMNGYQFRYKPKVAAAIGEDTTPRIGTMAQEVEQGPAGENVVAETENGKALDVNRALGFSLAGLAGLDKRLALLEAATGGGHVAKGTKDGRVELGYDPRPGVAGLYRVQGSTIGEAPEDEAYRRAAGVR